MKCAIVNKSIGRKKSAEYGMKEAANKISLYLDYALSDKCGYSPAYIGQIHATIDKYLDDVYEGRVSTAKLQETLRRDYGAIVELEKNRIKPKGRNVNFVSGVYSFMDKFNVILLYVLIVKYRMSSEKVNTIMKYIQHAIECYNMGYISEDEIREIISCENNITPALLGGDRFAK